MTYSAPEPPPITQCLGAMNLLAIAAEETERQVLLFDATTGKLLRHMRRALVTNVVPNDDGGYTVTLSEPVSFGLGWGAF